MDTDKKTKTMLERKGCLKKPQYDPTTDLFAYAHRCKYCNQVSYFPYTYPDCFCRHCGKPMIVGDKNDD